MAWTLAEVTALLKSQGSAVSGQDERSWRTAQLKELLASFREEGADDLAALVEKLADGARDPAWRLPLGDSGLLEFVLSVVPKEPQHPLNKQALRLVGNACADCDENRARVVESGGLFSFIIDCIKLDALLPFAIAAAMNVCVDCDPAQLQASEAGLSKVLVDLVSGERLSAAEPSLSHIMTILEFLCNQDPEPKLANPKTPALLLDLATGERYDADLDTFMEICAPALAYLTFQSLQPVFLESGDLELLQLAFVQLYTRFDGADADPDTATQLKQVGNTFLTILADISALPGFSTTCPLNSKAAQALIDWLNLPTLTHLQTAACLSLGNLSRSDESSTALLEHVQEPLLDILTRAIPPNASQPPAPRASVPPLQLIHASLSFLKNLAIPSTNKPILGAALLDPSHPILPRIWTSTRTQPQLQFAAVSLTRLLLVNCPPNVRLLCTPLPANGDSDEDNTDHQPSNLALLTTTAFSADEDPIKMEAARAASLVCRALHSPSSTPILDPSWTWSQATPSPSPDSTATFYTTHRPILTTSLTHLLTNPRFPPIRSDTIFVLALMSRSPAGARMALSILQSDTNKKAAWHALAHAIAGPEVDKIAADFLAEGSNARITEEEEEQEKEKEEKGIKEGIQALSLAPQQVDPQTQKQQQQPGGMAKMDRENAMVLVAELLQSFPEELAGLRKPLEAVLAKGGELVVQDREGQ